MNKQWLGIVLLIVSLLTPQLVMSTKFSMQNQYTPLPPSSKKLKVMTYNIRGARTELGNVNLDSIIKQIQSMDPDIVALQEVDYNLPRSRFQNQAKVIAEQLQMNYLYVANIHFVIGSYGNAILSKYPISRYEHTLLPSGLETRGILKAEINIGIQTVDVYTTHLGLDSTERIEQVNKLTSSISMAASTPKLLLGDFNSLPTEIPIQSLRSIFIDPLYENGLDITTYKNKQRNLQLDYILYSNDFTFDSVFIEECVTSDHNPLMYSLQLPAQMDIAKQ